MKNRLKVGQPFTWEGKPARIVSGPPHLVCFSVFADEGRRNRIGGYQFELAGFYSAIENGTAVVPTIPPHIAKQARVLGELFNEARADMLAKIEAGKVPEDWDAFEVRTWAGDYLRANYIPRSLPSPRRAKAYKKAVPALL
jgi:hypothetical protein